MALGTAMCMCIGQVSAQFVPKTNNSPFTVPITLCTMSTIFWKHVIRNTKKSDSRSPHWPGRGNIEIYEYNCRVSANWSQNWRFEWALVFANQAETHRHRHEIQARGTETYVQIDRWEINILQETYRPFRHTQESGTDASNLPGPCTVWPYFRDPGASLSRPRAGGVSADRKFWRMKHSGLHFFIISKAWNLVWARKSRKRTGRTFSSSCARE